jgi:hypothetical protein
LSAINAYVRASDARIVFDLDNEQAKGFYVGLSRVNQFFRYQVDTDSARSYNEIEIRMSTQKATTDFNSFAALQRWLNIGKFTDLINSRTWRAQKRSVNMVLMFRLPTPKPIADLRINITEILDAFNCDDVDSLVIVQESHSSKRDAKPIRLRNLRLAVFLLLSDILEQFPSEANQPPPQIWINGHGNVLCATYPATLSCEEITVPGRYNYDDGPINHKREDRRMETLDEAWVLSVLPYYELVVPQDKSTLIGVWTYLRYWGSTHW